MNPLEYDVSGSGIATYDENCVEDKPFCTRIPHFRHDSEQVGRRGVPKAFRMQERTPTLRPLDLPSIHTELPNPPCVTDSTNNHARSTVYQICQIGSKQGLIVLRVGITPGSVEAAVTRNTGSKRDHSIGTDPDVVLAVIVEKEGELEFTRGTRLNGQLHVIKRGVIGRRCRRQGPV